MNGLILRSFRPSDAIGLAMLYHRAVRDGAAGKYDAAQRTAWSPDVPTHEGWRAHVEDAMTIVAERDGVLLGFMTLDVDNAYLDFAYVAPEVMGQGVASALYAIIEGRARVHGLARLET